MSGLIHFSLNASENGAAAPPINWQEGMPANAVNNSAREVMAALARWRDDNNGRLAGTRSGGGTYLVTSNQGLTAAAFERPLSLTFVPNQPNLSHVLLDVDGTGAREVRRPGGIDLGPGDLLAGVPCAVRWIPGAGHYVLVWPTIERPGRIEAFASETSVPPGYVLCDGRAVSRSDFRALFAVLGSIYGTGDGVTTFNVPDLRGRALFGFDAMGGLAAGRLTNLTGLAGGPGTYGGLQAVTLTVGQMPSHGHSGTVGEAGAHNHGGATGSAGAHDHGGATLNAGGHTHTGTTGGGGGHSHSGATEPSGAHVHPLNYSQSTLFTYGGSGQGVAAINPNGPGGSNNATGATDSTGQSSGVHQHNFTTSAIGDHTHALTTNPSGDHAHVISQVAAHAHGIGPDGSHTHALSLAAAGGNEGHLNVPPAAIVFFAIKA